MFKRITMTLLAMLMLATMTTSAQSGKPDDPVEDPNPAPVAELLPVGDATDIRYIDGMLGVGTNSPQYKLDVNGQLMLRGTFRMSGDDIYFAANDRGDGGRAMVRYHDDLLVINFANDFTGGVQINGATTVVGGLSVSGTTSLASGLSVQGSTAIFGNLSTSGNFAMSGNDFSFETSTRGNGGRALVHDANDGLTINYANDFAGGVKIASGLSVLGSGNFTGTVTTGSSRELKNEIARLSGEEAVKALMELVPVRYKYKTNADELELGFIAEDVPDLVARNDRKSLSPMDFAALSVTVIQEQQRLIQLQQKDNQEQQAQIDQLKALVNELLSNK